jgi:hypothetical protein
MEDKVNGWHTSHHDDNIKGSSRDAEVPSSLLPNVLHRLGLAPGQALSELSFDDLVAKLKSDDWNARAAAVRALGKRDADVPIELLVPALDDEDEAVRAAAVHALGKVARRASLDGLVAALQDADWHVRETAVLALGKQEQHIPDNVFLAALHDTDGSVREAAMLALQWNFPEERSFTWNGQRWEKKTMHNNGYDTAITNSKAPGSISEIAPNDDWNSGSDAERPFAVQEQVQAYAPQEPAFYEYGDAISSHGEKLTARRGSQRGWWVAIATAALLFFLLGVGIATWAMPARTLNITAPSMQAKPFPLWNSGYNWIAANDIATSLRLTPQQIATQLQTGKSMTGIAAQQGVSASMLHTIELNAFQHMFDVAVKSGGTSQQDADEFMQQLQNSPPFLDKMTIMLFLADTQPPPQPTPQPAH